MMRRVPDALFEHPTLAALYDVLDPDRSDLDWYANLAAEFGASKVVDIGCGTGTFALLLAEHGLEVTALDPAAASLDVARGKPGAHMVRWLHGDATALTALRDPGFDLATMTANVAQAIVEPDAWRATLGAVHGSLRPGGRDPGPGGTQLAEMEPRGLQQQHRTARRGHGGQLGGIAGREPATGVLSLDIHVPTRFAGADLGLHPAVPGPRRSGG